MYFESNKLHKGILALLVLLSLAYIWSSQWFITTDGPSHAYNAMVLGELVFGDDPLFSEHLEVFWFPYPNWTGHILLMGLLQVFEVNVAEKLLFSLYAVVFFTGYFKWARIMQWNPLTLVSLMALFMFPRTFAAGFFNYQLGFAILPWALLFFSNALNKHSIKSLVLLTGSVLILYFTHPIPYLIFLMISGLWVLIRNQWWRSVSERRLSLGLVLSILPSLLLMTAFLAATVNGSVPAEDDFKTMWHGFLELDSLVNYNLNREAPVNIGISVFIGVLMIAAMISLFWQRVKAIHCALFAGFCLMTFVFFFQPGTFSSAGILSFRTQFIPYLLAVWFIVSCFPKVVWQDVVSGMAITGFILMLNIRLPHKLEASKAVEELMTATDHMTHGSVSIGLSCNHYGYINGKIISRSNWAFTHVADYLNVRAKQLSLINYESGQFHFPIKWKVPFNTYSEFACHEGLEHIPPCLDIGNMEEKLGLSVDNVFLAFPNDENLRNHRNYKQTVSGLKNRDFSLEFSSENTLVELYSRH